jgi:hypothetical protein
VLFSLRVDVVLLETAENELVALFDFELVDELQCFLLNVSLARINLCKLLVTLKEDLNCLDTDRDEFLPCDFAVGVFVGKGKEDTDVTFAQVVLVKLFKGFKELVVLQFTGIFLVVFREKFN